MRKSGTKWSPEKIEHLRKLAPTTYKKEIGAILGRTESAVDTKMGRLQIKGRGWRPEEIELLREMAGQASRKDIAQVVGRSFAAVTSQMTQLGFVGRNNSANNLAIRQYMMRYQVSRRCVMAVGVERLEKMSPEARDLVLHLTPREAGLQRARRVARQKPARPTKQENQDRIERMMRFAERCA
jgi:hypothetical protein